MHVLFFHFQDFCSLLKVTKHNGLQLARKGHQNNVTCFIHDMVDWFKVSKVGFPNALIKQIVCEEPLMKQL